MATASKVGGRSVRAPAGSSVKGEAGVRALGGRSARAAVPSGSELEAGAVDPASIAPRFVREVPVVGEGIRREDLTSSERSAIDGHGRPGLEDGQGRFADETADERRERHRGGRGRRGADGRLDLRLVKGDGERGRVSSAVRPLEEVAGRPAGVAPSYDDRLCRLEKMLTAILEGMAEGEEKARLVSMA